MTIYQIIYRGILLLFFLLINLCDVKSWEINDCVHNSMLQNTINNATSCSGYINNNCIPYDDRWSYAKYPYADTDIDGCSDAGIHNIAIIDFTPACNSHDWCYRTVDKPKFSCDNDFLLDMTDMCNDKYAPKKTIKMVKEIIYEEKVEIIQEEVIEFIEETKWKKEWYKPWKWRWVSFIEIVKKVTYKDVEKIVKVPKTIWKEKEEIIKSPFYAPCLEQARRYYQAVTEIIIPLNNNDAYDAYCKNQKLAKEYHKYAEQFKVINENMNADTDNFAKIIIMLQFISNIQPKKDYNNTLPGKIKMKDVINSMQKWGKMGQVNHVAQ